MQEVGKEIMKGFEVRNPDILFCDRLNLDLGDVHLRLIYWGDAIYHSSIFVHIAEDNMLVGMGMGSGPWLPVLYGKANLNGIRRGISVLDELCNDGFQIDLMIGVHSPDLIRTRQHLHPRKKYLEDLLNGLTETKQQGLSLEQVKDEFSFNKRYARFQKTFTLP